MCDVFNIVLYPHPSLIPPSLPLTSLWAMQNAHHKYIDGKNNNQTSSAATQLTTSVSQQNDEQEEC